MQNDGELLRKHSTMKPAEAEKLPCPRCYSTNTKFCYYNNYNLSQPRYFCKACRRYWTLGETLRNVPLGGGSRKNAKRSRPSCSAPDVTEPYFEGQGLGVKREESSFYADLKFSEGSFTSLLTQPGSGLGLGSWSGFGPMVM